MIVVMTTYEDGWCKKNLHTYTIDYGTIFELSEDSDSDSGNINLSSVPTHGSVSTSFTSTINPRLQVGNLVLCLPDDSGQKFFIVDKVV